MVKVSVIIPAYNVQSYIEKCVRSVLNQTLHEIEVIVVNDGSVDQTLKVLKSIEDQRLIVIDQKNVGVSIARNVAIAQACGEYLFQLDSDDWIEPDGLFDLYQLAVKEDAEIIISDAYFDYGQDSKLIYFQGAKDLTADLVQDLLLGKISPNIWTKLYKRSLFVDHKILYTSDITIGEDLFINLQLFYYAKKVSRLPKAYVHYIQRDVSLTKVYSERLFQVYKMIELVKKFLIEENQYLKYQKELECLEYLHTYYYRIMVDTSSRKIHRTFYKNASSKYDHFLANPFILQFLKEQNAGEQNLEKLFRMNYWVGCLRLRLAKIKQYYLNRN